MNIISWVLAIVAASLPLEGQTATLHGQVTDVTGAVVVGANVTLNGPSGLAKNGTSTNGFLSQVCDGVSQ